MNVCLLVQCCLNRCIETVVSVSRHNFLSFSLFTTSAPVQLRVFPGMTLQNMSDFIQFYKDTQI